VSALVRTVVVVAAAALGASGCAHAVLIETEPKNARIFVDGELVGEGPQTIERRVIVGDQLRVQAQADGYEDAAVSVAASEWYPYPGLLALVPLLGIPIAIPITILGLPLLGVGLIIGPLVAVGWAVVTSPTIASLAFTRKYPDVVKLKLIKKKTTGDPLLLPADLFGVPDDISPNPIPDVGPIDDGPAAPKQKKGQPAGGNPVP
jgi:hypothetical protein